MEFQRLIATQIQSKLYRGKAVIVYGARQVGKTTLVKELLKSESQNCLELNCDNPDIRERLENQDINSLAELIGKNKIVFIDEAQRVQNIGLSIKLIVDNLKNVQVIASGSSALELANKISEPLTGRKYSFQLFPISIEEKFGSEINQLEFEREIKSLLIYGSYPEILRQEGLRDKQELITELAGDLLFKDIYTFQQIKNPSILRTLLKALAFQIGSQVSSNELASLVGIDKNTIESYIDILEKNFIIIRIQSFSRNLRKELKKSRKIFFLDLGIRNSLINNFNSIESRNDVGALWENYCVIERIKHLIYSHTPSNNYFWRTYDNAEIDWVEERGGDLHAFEIKWRKKAIVNPPKSWIKAYPNSKFKVITVENAKCLIE